MSNRKFTTVICGLFTVILLLTGCSTTEEPPSTIHYDDVLENGFGLSVSETVERYQFDESTVIKEEKTEENREIWTLPTSNSVILGYPATISLTFDDGLLTHVDYLLNFDNENEETYEALIDLYNDVEKKLGEPSDFWNNQKPFDRFSNFNSFEETVKPVIETDGIYMEGNNWLLSNPEDMGENGSEYVNLRLMMFESGSATIELLVYRSDS